MTGDTRVVLATAAIGDDPIGCVVVHHGAVMQKPPTTEDNEKGVVHDCVLRVIAFTLLQPDLLGVVPARDGSWDMVAFLERLRRFLSESHRMIETHSGQPLINAFLVRIDSKTLKVTASLGDNSAIIKGTGKKTA